MTSTCEYHSFGFKQQYWLALRVASHKLRPLACRKDTALSRLVTGPGVQLISMPSKPAQSLSGMALGAVQGDEDPRQGRSKEFKRLDGLNTKLEDI